MTHPDLARAAELCEAATPGPWRRGSVEKYNVFCETADGDWLGHERVVLRMNVHFPYEADAAFIAESRTLIPQLLSHISAQSARIGELEAERDKARRHPFAPERCPVCEWTNINLMNYGEPGKPRWMCHGCAARGLAAVESLAALGREACELGQRLAELECDSDAEDRLNQIELAIAAAVGTEGK